MSGGRPDTQILIAALGAAAQIARRRHGQVHAQQMEQLRQGSLATVLDALVNQRVEAVKQGFAALLTHYAEDARHYREQQVRFADRELECADPFRRIELRSRINDIDTGLAMIRAEARLVYAQMTEVIGLIGGSTHDFARELVAPLALPSAGTGDAWHDA